MSDTKIPPGNGEAKDSAPLADTPDGVQVDANLFLLQDNAEGGAISAMVPSEADHAFLIEGSFGDELLETAPMAGGKEATGLHTLAELEVAAEAEIAESPVLESSGLEAEAVLELDALESTELPPEVRRDFTESEMLDPELALELPLPMLDDPGTSSASRTQVEAIAASPDPSAALESAAELAAKLEDFSFERLEEPPNVPPPGFDAPAEVAEGASNEAELSVDFNVDPPLEALSFGQTNPALPLASRDTYGAGELLSAADRSEQLLETPPEVPVFGGGVASATGPQDVETVRRYAMLKEREVVEKESTIKALQNQMTQIRERLKRSDTERRRLQISLDENESVRRSLEDAREQHKHHVAKLEQVHQEELRSVQLRLDNAQFQGSKAERKLDDFRERVRSDIQKIRTRERELANRLELQKRDAEALLAVKDERLLQQKREIDRLEYDLEILQERLVEETEKAEDRISKLHRAVQAMRLAQGLLSGLDEEVLPSVAAGDDDGDQAA